MKYTPANSQENQFLKILASSGDKFVQFFSVH